MKKVTSIVLAVVLAMSTLTTVASADAKKGQKYYLKKLKVCKKDGLKNAAIFASKHDRATWASIKEGGKLMDTWKELCPSGIEKFDKMKPKHIKNLYDFVWQYASDGDIPSCG